MLNFTPPRRANAQGGTIIDNSLLNLIEKSGFVTKLCRR